MRRALVAMCLAFTLWTWPVNALAAGNRILIDATFMVMPPTLVGPCLRLDPGQVTARARNTGLSPPGSQASDLRPVGFRLTGYRGADPNGRIDLPVTREESTSTARVAGGVYCWVLDVDAPTEASSPTGTPSNYAQLVALQLTWTP